MLILAFIFLAASPPPSHTQTQTPSNINPPSIQFAPQKTTPSSTQTESVKPRQQTTTQVRTGAQTGIQSVFTAPGTATLQGSQWVGNENLYNLSKDLGVSVEIIKPASSALPFNEGSITGKIFEQLKQAKINPRAVTVLSSKNTPLPFLHILIMVYPIEKGYVAYCAARVFEEVENKRVYLKQDIIWQAITWEKQELIVSPSETFQEEVESALQLVVKAFIERFQLQPKANQS